MVLEAAKAIEDDALIARAKTIAIQVADTFINEAIDNDGGVLNEKNLDTNHTDYDKHWWPQVEALVGLKYAFEIDKNECYLEFKRNIWDFTKKHLIDYKHGEWHFRVNQNGKPYKIEDKVSMWKAPYHTARALMVLTKN